MGSEGSNPSLSAIKTHTANTFIAMMKTIKR